ncbi:utrophin-like isoform X3 [Portunus trituberculatus]|uniref:utrophin-like isoform X3 n=1 Tax=Portunus trituberculatus TaxID=210409 RepID=UPI001E1CE039|nr:utrophin-like isoform X3 [Portunus trituberculatus]
MRSFRRKIVKQHNDLIGKLATLRETLKMSYLYQDEREDVQKKTFAKWINSQLAKGHHPPVTDLFYDLRDGTRLLALLEVLTGRQYKREKGRMRVHHLNNVSRAMAVLEESSVKLVNISNEHIVDGNAKLTLGLVWAVILHWQVQGVLRDVMADLQQTSLEKTLLAWCRQTTKGYQGVEIDNFTTSWSDGLALNALIHSQRPRLFEWTVVARKHPLARLDHAFRTAQDHLGIERLLDPEDVNSQVPDKKSIMMYVMCLFQALPHDSLTVEALQGATGGLQAGMGAAALSPEGSGGGGRPLSTVSIGLGGYQRTLEEVLGWLLGAEDRLAAMPPIADSTHAVKDQFHDLEELMLDLTARQGGVGEVLGEGSRLLREGVMEEEEEEEVRVQMKLLNTRWEELRVRAMERQARLHHTLMALQETQLDALKRWLTLTEERIANMSQVGPSTSALRQQVAAHQELQHDLEAEQSNINSLSNMVVVVDEANSDSAYSSLEDELNALGERWAHICRWTESRWSTLQTLSQHWPRFEEEVSALKEWLKDKEKDLRDFESDPATEEEKFMRQASYLQVVEAEMDLQQRRFDGLQDLSGKILIHIPEESPTHTSLPQQLEDLQDRLDLLASIIEAQTARLSACGIDISKVAAPVQVSSGGGGGGGGGEVVRSATTTITTKDASTTLITKVVTTKVTETVSASSAKRQKLEGGTQVDFSVALAKLGEWMGGVEGKVDQGEVDQLPLHQLSLLHDQLQAEVESQQDEYNKVVSLGESVVSETATIGEPCCGSEEALRR